MGSRPSRPATAGGATQGREDKLTGKLAHGSCPAVLHSPSSGRSTPSDLHSTTGSHHQQREDDLTFLSDAEKTRVLGAYAEMIFAKADVNGDSLLDHDEFLALVQSATLALDIDDDEAERMLAETAKAKNGVAVTFDEFQDLVLDLVRRHSQVKKAAGAPDWQWFPIYLDDDPGALPVYLNVTKVRFSPPIEKAFPLQTRPSLHRKP